MAASLAERFESPKAKVALGCVVAALVLSVLWFGWLGKEGPSLSTAPPSGSTKAVVSGVVTDFQGKPVPNLNLVIKWAQPDFADKKPYTATTDASGKFRVPDMVNGQFSIGPADRAWVGGSMITADAEKEVEVTLKVRRR
ncbi:MAG TPA: carboxypeptidase-like regulatory domain-containing protein [Tepidisphaeraceae bacterium]|nr:carboxypeptidase-like regulatory domain-containing protein [Tepidisphaeraceae bacterium]